MLDRTRIGISAAGLFGLTLAAANPALAAGDMVKNFDVAENHTRFVFQDAPVHDNGMPAYGNPFVTQGYIYPAGTLDGEPGITEDGAAQFPDKVIGTWTCSGWFVGDGAKTKSGQWVMTRQIYDFGERGDDILITQGPEYIEKDNPYQRIVTGGTGAYDAFDGRVEQTMLGFHEHGGVKFRFRLDGEEQG